MGMSLWRASAVVVALAARAGAADSGPAPAALDTALERADRLFVAGDQAGALAVLEPACSGSERPECAFSLGAVHHGLGHCPEALAHYRRYRDVAPRGERIAEVTAALEEVEARCGGAALVQPPRDDAARGLQGVPPTAAVAAPSGASPLLEPAAAPSLRAAPEPAPLSQPSSLAPGLMIGSFALAGAAAVGGVVFGVLAAESASECGQARAYSAEYRSQCEVAGPRYQGLWQGLALASASFLGIGLTLWWIDSSSSAMLGVSASGAPLLSYRREL